METKNKTIMKVLFVIGAVIITALLFLLTTAIKQEEKGNGQASAKDSSAAEAAGIAEVDGTEKVSETLKQELTQIRGYLEQMEGAVADNQESLGSLSGENATFIERYEALEEKMSHLRESLKNFQITYEDGDGEIREQFLVIETAIDESLADLKESHGETRRILSDMEMNQSDRQNALKKLLSDIKKDVDSARKALEQSGADILTYLEGMTKQQETEREEETLFFEQMHEEMVTLITEDMNVLMTALEEESSAIQILMEDKSQNLLNRMNQLQDQIHSAQDEIGILLSDMEGMADARQAEIQESFNGLQQSLTELGIYYTQTHEEVKSLLQEAKESSSENHLSLVSVLEQMEKQMSENSQSSLSLLMESLEQMNLTNQEAFTSIANDMTSSFENMDQTVGNRFSSLDTQLNVQFNQLGSTVDNRFNSFDSKVSNQLTDFDNRVSNQFSDLDVNFSSQMDDIANALHNQYTDMTSIINGGDDGLRQFINDSLTETNRSVSEAFTGMDQKLDSVFQSASNGKKMLASALLAKSVTIAEDATFTQIKDAILSIPQQLVIGVEQLPGTVSYDYHYHDGTTMSGDGCYTLAVYHTHSSGCYRNTRCSCGGFSGNQHIELGCERCGHHFNNHWPLNSDTGRYEPGPCGVNISVLGCGKNSSTLEKYSLGCGLTDGQIVAAHIVYNQEAVNSAAALSLWSDGNTSDDEHQVMLPEEVPERGRIHTVGIPGNEVSEIQDDSTEELGVVESKDISEEEGMSEGDAEDGNGADESASSEAINLEETKSDKTEGVEISEEKELPEQEMTMGMRANS